MIIGQPVRRVADIEPLTRYMQGIEPALRMDRAEYDEELGAYRVVYMIGPGLLTLTVHTMPSPEWLRNQIAIYEARQRRGAGLDQDPPKLESEG